MKMIYSSGVLICCRGYYDISLQRGTTWFGRPMAADRKDNYSHIRLFCQIYSKLLEGVYCSHLRVDNEQIEGIELSNGDHSSSQISKTGEIWAAKRVALQAQIDRWVVLDPERLEVSFRGLVAGLDSRIWGSVFSIPDAYDAHDAC